MLRGAQELLWTPSPDQLAQVKHYQQHFSRPALSRLCRARDLPSSGTKSKLIGLLVGIVPRPVGRNRARRKAWSPCPRPKKATPAQSGSGALHPQMEPVLAHAVSAAARVSQLEGAVAKGFVGRVVRAIKAS